MHNIHMSTSPLFPDPEGDDGPTERPPVDLGPEGGDAGGRVVAQGPPWGVADVAESDTGRFLSKDFEFA